MTTLIIGAGPTGLGAAWALERAGEPYLLVEREARVGGAASSFTDVHGFTWDFGGHVIHSHFPDFDQALAEAEVPMTMVERTGAIWMESDWHRTPLQQQLSQMPADIMPGHPADNLRDWLRVEMGSDLSERFFWPFNLKMWATPLHQLEHTWTSLSSGSNAANVPRVGLRRENREAEFFPYPVLGNGDIWERIGHLLDPERLVHGTVRELDLAAHTVTLDGGRQLGYSRLISTMPLTMLLERSDLAGWTYSGDASVSHTLPAHTAEIVLGLGFEGDVPRELADKTYIYNPHPEIAWHRASLLSNYSRVNAPTGHWSILFEASVSDTRPVTPEQLRRDALRFVAHFAGPYDLVPASEWSTFLPYGYPLPTLGRDDMLRELHGVLEERDVQSRGRFGGGRYESCNQDYSFAQGVQAARGEEPTVLWKPETF